MNTIKITLDFSVNILLTFIDYAPDSSYFPEDTEQHNQKVHICEDTVSISYYLLNTLMDQNYRLIPL